MTEYLLETRALSKSFKKTEAVRKLNLRVRKNTIYGLLGPNGAGKSTTLKMMTGMLRPTAGEIIFNGHSWSRKDLENMGVLIELPPLYDNLTAEENLKVRTTLLGLPEKRIGQVLKIVDLKNTGSKRAGQFSMGMKQRLGIALALLGNPKLLILDEPTNGLDPIGIQELRELIRSFPKNGILSEVELMADDIGIISDGVLGYQSKIHKGENLEALFMQVVKNSRAQEGGDISC